MVKRVVRVQQQHQQQSEDSIPSTTPAAGLDAFGDVLQPRPLMGGGGGMAGLPAAVSPAVSEPLSAASKTPTSTGGGLLKGDLDATLASLAQNLDINGPKQAAARKWVCPRYDCALQLWGTLRGGFHQH